MLQRKLGKQVLDEGRKMKKISLILTLILLLQLPSAAFAKDEEYPIYVNDEKIDIQYSYVYENTPCLPIRAMAEYLGFVVSWDSVNNCICIAKGEDCMNENGAAEVIIIYLDTDTATIWQNSRQFRTMSLEFCPVKMVDDVSYIDALDFSMMTNVRLKPRTNEEGMYLYTR